MTEDENDSVFIDVPAHPLGSGLGRKRSRRLHSIANVKACLADVIRRLEDDRIDVGKARAMVYALSTLAGVIQSSDLEQRIKKLEGRQ